MLKRKYTVSAKVLAACLANLIKANAVSKDIRFRRTPRRLRACRANLLKAQVAVRAADGHSPAYAPCFRRGLYCVSLARSLERAGESRREYQAHLRLFDRVFAPVGRIERKLVRALAGTAWRHHRAFHGQARWERAAVAYLLAESGRGEPPDELWPPSPADRHEMLAEDILKVLWTDAELHLALRRLDERFERLLRVWLEHGSGPVPAFQFFTAPRSSDSKLLLEPVAALTNPFLPPSRVARALQPRSPALRGIKHWDWRVKDDEASLHHLDFCQGMVSEKKALRYGFLRGSSLDRAGDFARFARLFATAFGGRDSADSAAPGSSSPQVHSAAQAVWARLEAYDRQAQQEAERLKQALGAGLRARTLDRAERRGRRLELAHRLLALFSHDEAAIASAFRLELEVRQGFYNLLTARYGTLARFAHLSPQKSKVLTKNANKIAWLHSILLDSDPRFKQPNQGRSPPAEHKAETLKPQAAKGKA
jgi:hypothetical protein